MKPTDLRPPRPGESLRSWLADVEPYLHARMEAEAADDVAAGFTDGFRAGEFSALHEMYRLLDSAVAETASDLIHVLHIRAEALLARRRTVLEKSLALRLSKRHGPAA